MEILSKIGEAHPEVIARMKKKLGLFFSISKCGPLWKL